jgi:cytoskeleton protein RodZ
MSTVAADEDAVPSAPRVGADLSAARQRLGWALEDVAAGLRIRLSFLMALEEGRIADLPGNAYAIGFLRTYATTLGLDPDELTRRFRAEAADVNRLTELSFPAPVPSRGMPAGAVVLLGIVLAIGAYVGWYRLSSDGALPPEVVPPVPTRLAPMAERAMPPATITQSSSTPSSSASPSAAAPSTAVSSTGAQPAASPPSATTAATSPGTAPALSVAPPGSPPATPSPGPASAPSAPPGQTDTAALPQLPPVPPVPPTQAAAATTMPTGTTAVEQSAIPQPRIVLSATADSWLLVREKTGQVLLNRVLHPGEFWSVPAQPNLVLTTGNAGGTDILVDGATTPSLGASGAVRRDIPLDPELLKSGKIPSAALPMTTASSSGVAWDAPYLCRHCPRPP